MAKQDDDVLKARRELAEQKLAEQKAKRAAREQSKEESEVEALEREANELEAIETAIATHGEIDDGIKVVRYEDGGKPGIVIVRRPETVAVRRFHDAAKFTIEAKDKFGRPFVVYPAPAKYAELTGRNVALMIAVADAAAWLGGIGRTKLDEKP